MRGDPAGVGSSVARGVRGRSAVAESHNDCLPGREEEQQEGSTRVWENAAVPGMLPAVLQEAAPCRGSHSMMKPGASAPPSNSNSRCLLDAVAQADVFPGEERCQE